MIGNRETVLIPIFKHIPRAILIYNLSTFGRYMSVLQYGNVLKRYESGG